MNIFRLLFVVPILLAAGIARGGDEGLPGMDQLVVGEGLLRLVEDDVTIEGYVADFNTAFPLTPMTVLDEIPGREAAWADLYSFELLVVPRMPVAIVTARRSSGSTFCNTVLPVQRAIIDASPIVA